MKKGDRQTRGIALVIVLGFLVLITVLIVAFFISVSTENTTVRTYADGASAKFLADSAVNVVEGQIAKATKAKGSGSKRLTWGSQPGMIRTYDDGGAASDNYKLYSAEKMVTSASDAALLAELKADVPSDWNKQPALYTDLNTPVKDPRGTLNFPILDGNVKSIQIGGTNVLTYDDDGNGKPDIEGFGIAADSVSNYDSSSPISAVNNPAPMPVRWLYILQDGAIATPDSGPGSQAKFTGSAHQPTKKNPIVGRIAFWADDETSKLNVNTASEGSDFSLTRFNTSTDVSSTSKTFGFAVSPPAAKEYNRYPGHPATTSLSVALGKWMDEGVGRVIPTAYSASGNDTAFLTGLDRYMALSPRMISGGSKAGTVAGATMSGTSKNSGYSTLTLDTDRIYASTDELVFKPSRTSLDQLVANGNERPLNKLQFFLTANSRSSEVTPFNTPKISMWPQWRLPADRKATSATTINGKTLKATANLLAFCSSFGSNAAALSKTNEYFIQRYDKDSWNSTTTDWYSIPRNQDLAKYLNRMGTDNIPGYGGNFVGKYGQIAYSSLIVQSFDYLRSNVGKVAYLTGDYSTGNQETWIAPLVVTGGLPGITPASPAKGYGNFPICTQIVVGLAADKSSYNAADAAAVPPRQKLRPFLMFNLFIPSQAFPGNNSRFQWKIENLNNLGISSLPNTATITPWGWYNNKSSTMRVFWYVFSDKEFSFSGNTITLGSLKIDPVIFSMLDGTGQTVQKISMKFPLVTVPAPKGFSRTSMDSGTNYWDGPTQILSSAQMPVVSATGVTWVDISPAVPAAVARGIECGAAGPLRGDWRLLGAFCDASSIAALDQAGNISKTDIYQPLNLLTPQGDFKYSNTSYRQVHSLRAHVSGAMDAFPYFGMNVENIRILDHTTTEPITSIAGSLSDSMTNTRYEDFHAPLAPVGLGVGNNPKAVNSTGRQGDWDTGPGLMPDGPYINPTDQLNNVTPANDLAQSQYFIQNDNPGLDYSATINITSAFNPNRLVASPVKFGSLPTGVDANDPKPWQTLLFCPNPASRITAANSPATAGDHPGFGTPPDHLYLEFFTMPTVEPYAVSEPLSTAGKVNLNCQLAPFTNIERTTALRGVLKSTLMTAVSPKDVAGTGNHPSTRTDAPRYKYVGNVTARYPNELRYSINRDATLKGVNDYYFAKGKIFRFASEICDVFLVPERIPGASYAGSVPPTAYDGMMSWWRPTLAADQTRMNLTGDNLREEPYDRIYPRLTTKSNTYTVHYRVQTLRKRGVSDPGVWEENKDTVTAEYRGSSVVERYIDPNDPALDAAWDADTINLKLDGKADLGRLYKFRVVSTKKFAL